MSNATAAPVVDSIKITDITVVAEDNPRGIVSKGDALIDLASSIKKDGLIQPVAAVRTPEGDLKLVAGYRRVEASKMAGLKEIPVYVRDFEDVEGAAYDENEQREEMSPMARAKSLARQKKQLGTNKKVAERRSLATQQVGALLAMTEMPDSVQSIAMKDREFGAAPAKNLTALSKIAGGEAVAIYLAEWGTREPKVYGKIATSLDGLLTQLDSYRDDNKNDKEALDKVPQISGLWGIQPMTLTHDTEVLTWLEDRAAKVKDVLGYEAQGITAYGEGTSHRFNLTEIELDALRAGNALIEEEIDEEDSSYRRRGWTFAFDTEMILDQLDQMLIRLEKDATKRLKEIEADAKERGENTTATSAAGTSGEQEPPKSNHAIAKEAAEKARANNETIGHNLLARSAKPLSKARNLAAIKVMARMAVTSDPTTAGAGNRLCFPSWKEVEVKELKSGEKREKVHYLEANDAQARLVKSIDDAKTIEEVVRIVTDALITATYGDQAEVAQSNRVAAGTDPRYVSTNDRKVIAELAKGMLPDEAEEQRKRLMERGF